MVFKRPEALGECDVIRAGNVLIAKEQHLVFEQRRAERCEQVIAARSIGQADAANLGADVAGKLVDAHGSLPRFRR
jgi:hypothetical protein